MTAELVLDARNAVGESPVWLASEQALYWVDIPARQLCRWQALPATCPINPLAGGFFALRPGVRGLAEPACIH